MTVRRPLVLVDGQFRQLPAGDTLEAAQGFFRTVAIAATAAGQTMYTVPGGYTPGAIFVSLNGSALAPADFTAADGASVVLESGAGIVVGSVLLVYVLSAFEVADALPLGGTAADASKLGGVVAAQFFRRSNILGTVSQSGGVPTGAAFQSVVNANGRALIFPDGTAICFKFVTVSYGAAAYLDSGYSDWPINFASASELSVSHSLNTVPSGIAGPNVGYCRLDKSATTIRAYVYATAGAPGWVSGNTMEVRLVAIGKVAI